MIKPDANGGDQLAARFEELAPRIYAYARRHVGIDAAEDIVSDTFLVAWRRRDELPPDLLPWLLVVARKTIGNRRRSDSRRSRLHGAAAQSARLAASDVPAAEDVAAERATTLAALSNLSELEREALLLVAWDGLAPADAAAVAGCSRRAFEVRISRARARLRTSLAALEQLPDPPPAAIRRTALSFTTTLTTRRTS